MSNIFSSLVESLLASEVICVHTEPQYFDYLNDDINRRTVNDYLLQIQRKVRRTSDGEAFLLAHMDMNTSTARLDAKWAFEQVIQHIKPIVLWLALIKRCDPLTRPLTAGNLIKESDLLKGIEDSEEITLALDNLCKIKLFQSESREPKKQLARVMQRLVDLKYIKPVSKNSSIYKATGKFSLFYDLLNFIKENESLEIEEPKQNQIEIGI